MESVECVLCGWRLDLTAPAIGVYLPRSSLPMAWKGAGIETVHPADDIATTMPGVALASHWGQDHPEQLRQLIGSEFELR